MGLLDAPQFLCIYLSILMVQSRASCHARTVACLTHDISCHCSTQLVLMFESYVMRGPFLAGKTHGAHQGRRRDEKRLHTVIDCMATHCSPRASPDTIRYLLTRTSTQHVHFVRGIASHCRIVESTASRAVTLSLRGPSMMSSPAA